MTEAIRGEGATLHDAAGERFVDELAPRDEVSRAIQARLRRVRRAIGRPGHARGRPRALPQRRRARCARRARPDARADPRRARRPLHDGRHRRRPARALDAARASTPSASPPAPACTAPTGSPPTRSASASCSRAAPSPRALVEPPRPAPRRRARPTSRALAALPAPPVAARHARGAVARRRHRAHRRGPLAACSTDPHPLARLIARCALARTESRGAHLRLDHPRARPRARPAPRRRSSARGRARLADLALTPARRSATSRERRGAPPALVTHVFIKKSPLRLYLDPFEIGDVFCAVEGFRSDRSLVRNGGRAPNHEIDREGQE